MALLITCETAGESIPDLVHLAQVDSAALSKAIDNVKVDRWALEVAQTLADHLGNHQARVECLNNPYHPGLVDVSHSLNHRELLGKFCRDWPEQLRAELLEVVYRSYRRAVEKSLQQILQQYTFVVHLSVRTFEPWSAGKPRRTDIGLLYDPQRKDELDFCLDWIDEAYEIDHNLRIRRNYPRRGNVDSLTKSMRSKFSADQYLGIEVWLNRAWVARPGRLRDDALAHFCESLSMMLGFSDIEMV